MSTITYTPAHESTGVDPLTWIEYVITPEAGNYLNPLASAGFGLSVTLGHEGGASAIIQDGVATSFLTDWGWEWELSDTSPGVDESITLRIRLTGGFQPNTEYGYPSVLPEDFYVASIAIGENVDGLDAYTTHNNVPWFSTGPYASSIQDVRYASAFGGIDDDVAAPDGLSSQDGGPWSAHTLALMERQLNYLTSRGDCCWSALFDARTDSSEEPGGFMGYGTPFWVPITPAFVIPKKPGRGLLDFYFGALAPASSVTWLQVTTSHTPFDPNAVYDGGNNNVTRIPGSGAGTTDIDGALLNIPCDPDANFETIQIFAMGLNTGDLGDTAANGSPNTGTVDACPTDTSLYDASATWDLTTPGSTDYAVAHSVRFEDANGATIVSPRLITCVTAATTLEFWPPLTINRLALRGATYVIEELPLWRLQYMEIYSQSET